jgi:hypothetical protein
MKVLLPLTIILLMVLSCREVDTPATEEEKPCIACFEKVDIYDGSMPNGWSGDTMVAKDGSVLADRRSVDGGVTWGPKIPLPGGAGRVLDETTRDILKLEPGTGNGTPSAGWIYLTTTGHYARFNLAWVTNGRDWKEFLPEKKL